MGKNQQHKAMQRGRGGGEDGAPEIANAEEGADVSFHTAEWHAARIAALTTERMSWEDWKKKQKEDLSAAKKLADAEEEKMREYREQLDADRAARLSKGTNNTHLRAQAKEMKAKKSKKDKKDKKSKSHKKEKKSKKKKGKERRESSSSGSDSKPESAGPVRLSDFLQS